jgi:AraC-like DNA-binding protein
LSESQATHRTVTEIAFACGFNDSSHFGRVFSGRMSMTVAVAQTNAVNGLGDWSRENYKAGKSFFEPPGNPAHHQRKRQRYGTRKPACNFRRRGWRPTYNIR